MAYVYILEVAAYTKPDYPTYTNRHSITSCTSVVPTE